MDLNKIKIEYLRKILKASLNGQNYSTVFIKASFPLYDLKDILEELKYEFNIENIIYFDVDYEKIKSFYETNPSDDEIEKFIPKYPIPTGNMKVIILTDDSTYYSNYMSSEYTEDYIDDFIKFNSELFDIISTLENKITISACPNKEWSKYLYGSQNRLSDLWKIINSNIPDIDQSNIESRNMIERRNELNKMNIRNLHFYTDLGTDFSISLNPSSIWVCYPEELGGKANYYNYPSYEIFTSPNCYSGNGKIVLSKKFKFFDEKVINSATLEFSKGKIVSCVSDNDYFDNIVKKRTFGLYRIGEIALVANSSPLKYSDFYGTRSLDENTACHFALGDSIGDCIGISEEKLAAKGPRYYRYNTSDYHEDIVFGNDSIVVEAETKQKQKVLLMEKGEWKI